MTGWIKIWRQLLNWEWSDVPEMMALWVRLLLMAGHEETTWHGITIEAGQLVTTCNQLAELSGLTLKQVRTCLVRLEESGQIVTERAGKKQLITISNYKQFQDIEIEKGQQNGEEKADKRQTKGRQRADKGQTKGELLIQEYKKKRSKEEKNINNNPLPPFQGGCPQEKKEMEKYHAVTRFDRIFEEEFARLTGDTFTWSRRENVAVNSIVGKIARMMEEKGKDPTAEEKENALRWFLVSLYNAGDDWIVSNFTPHIINDKFNEFYQTIKNANNGKRNKKNPAGVSAEYLASVASQLAD